MGKTLARFVYWVFCLGMILEGAFAASRLEFPRLALQATQILGVAIANPNAEQAELTVTAFAGDGTVLANRNVTVPPASQVSLLASEIFPDLDLSQVSWFRAQSMSNDLTGFFLLLDSQKGQLDGADLPVRSRNLIFSRIEGNDSAGSQINLVNPGGVEAHVTAILRQGTEAQQRIFTLPGEGAEQFSIREFFDADSISPPAELEIVSDEDLIGFQLIIYTGGDLVGLNAQSRSERLNTLYFPQMVLGGGFDNLLSIRNQSDEPVEIVISAHGPDGSILDLPSNPVSMDLPGAGLLQRELALLFEFDPEQPQTGWLEVHANRPSIVGELVYRVEPAGAAAAVAALQSGSQRILLSHLATTLDFFTGLALLNPGQFPAALRGVALSADGEPLGHFDLVLLPGQRISRLITELIATSEGQNGGLIWLESDSPIFATALFGNGTSLLANIPPQPSPPRFRADLTFPPRPQIDPIQAAAAPGQGVQFTSDSQVAWQVNGSTGGSAQLGMVDENGHYSAPESLPELKTVSLSAVAGEGVAAAAIDLLSQSEVATSQHGLTHVASLPLTGRIYVSGPAGGPAGVVGETLYQLVDQQLEPVLELGFDVQSMLGTAPSGQERLVLLATTGQVYEYLPEASGLDLIPGADSVTAIAWDPVSESLLATIGSSLRGFELDGPGMTPQFHIQPRRLPAYSLGTDSLAVSGLAVDRCSGDIFFATQSGGVYRFYRSQAQSTILAEVGSSPHLLPLYRRGVSCPSGLEMLASDETGELNLLNPTSGARIESWLDAQSVGDLGLIENGRILTLQEGQDVSRLVAVETASTYAPNPLNPPRIEFLPTLSRAPGLDLEVISTTATSGQSAAFNLFLRTSESTPSVLVFSLDLDDRALIFDDSDLNEDGIPDSILPLFPGDFSLSVQFDPTDEDGELDFIIADLAPPFASLKSGKLFTISFQVANDWEGSSDLLFSSQPGASAADVAATTIDFDEAQSGTVSVSRRR